jgi:hypothetical protein
MGFNGARGPCKSTSQNIALVMVNGEGYFNSLEAARRSVFSLSVYLIPFDHSELK